MQKSEYGGDRHIEINVFLLCYNEEPLLPHTIKHYKKYLPSCKITIYDNESTDNSVKIAKELGCNIVSWNSNNKIDDLKYIEIKDNCWKCVKTGWVIVADMDEFVCVTEDDLINEKRSGVTILNIECYNIIGESKTLDLTDIDLQLITKYVKTPFESKKLCFLREAITDMNYSPGAHSCKPKGRIIYSPKVYMNKHMSFLGLPYLKDKIIKRFNRNKDNRKKGFGSHYTDNIAVI
jgi:hypothetical protein